MEIAEVDGHEMHVTYHLGATSSEIVNWTLFDEICRAELGRMALCMFRAGERRGLEYLTIEQQLSPDKPTYIGKVSTSDLDAIDNWWSPRLFGDRAENAMAFKVIESRRQKFLAH